MHICVTRPQWVTLAVAMRMLFNTMYVYRGAILWDTRPWFASEETSFSASYHIPHVVTIWSHVPIHNDVIKWKHFPRNWPFVQRIHRSPVNSPHKVQWRGTLMFSLISARINAWVNNDEAGDLRRNRAHCDVIVMILPAAITTEHRRYVLDTHLWEIF